MSKDPTEAGMKSLERLYDYTKFHIGVYLTLTAAFITVATATGEDDTFLIPLNREFIVPAIVGFLFAGAAGGIIASSLTERPFVSSAEFLDTKIGPSSWEGLHFLKARIYTHIEHYAFWFGIACALLSFGK